MSRWLSYITVPSNVFELRSEASKNVVSVEETH